MKVRTLHGLSIVGLVLMVTGTFASVVSDLFQRPFPVGQFVLQGAIFMVALVCIPWSARARKRNEEMFGRAGDLPVGYARRIILALSAAFVAMVAGVGIAFYFGFLARAY